MPAVLGYSNQIDQSTLSGGTWAASYPLANLKNRYLYQKARSSSTSATIAIDLGKMQRIGVIALCSHNLTTDATVRIRGSHNANMADAIYDSGVQSAYYGSDFASAFKTTTVQYWQIDVTDAGNPSGYVEFGRVFIGWKFQPATNISYGASWTIETRTTVKEAYGGAEYFDARRTRRVWNGKWEWLDDGDAYTVMMAILRNQDISREVYWFEETDIIDSRDQRWMLGRLRELSQIEWPYVNTHAVGVQIGELL